MSNQAEIDYEKQFQEDLAKATALSIEQQALDEYRRNKKYGYSSAYNTTSTHSSYERSQSTTITDNNNSSYYAQVRQRPATINSGRGTSTEGTPPPPTIAGPPLAPLRRHSEVSNAANQAALHAATQRETRSRTPPPPESDLISFASPTTKKPENSSTFDRLIEDLQRIQTNSNSNSLVPLGTIAASGHSLYRPAAAPAVMYAQQYSQPAGAAAGMQLVPFTPPPQQQKVPLTQEELQKLYNMPQQQPVHAFAPHPHAAMGFVSRAAAPAAAAAMPYHGVYPQSAPAVVVASPSAAFMQPQYPAPYGFNFGGGGVATAAASAIGFRQSANTTTPPVPLTASASVDHTQHMGSQHNALVAQLPKSNSASAIGHTTNGALAASGSSSAVNNMRRPTPPARKRTGEDLIDLSHEDDSRVSVLEAFDPLHKDYDDDYVWKKLTNTQ